MYNLIVSAITTYILGQVLPGITINNSWAVFWFALWLGILNATLGKMIKFTGCVFNILTLGLFNLFVNGAMVLLADRILDGIQIDRFFTALFISIILSIVTSIFQQNEEKNNH